MITSFQKRLFTGLLLTTLTCGTARASHITLVNNYGGDLEVLMEPGEGGVVVADKPNIRHPLKKGTGDLKINVEKADLGNNDTFTVTGTATMPSSENKCKGLFVDKDYRIVFSGGGLGGVVCRAEEIRSQKSSS